MQQLTLWVQGQAADDASHALAAAPTAGLGSQQWGRKRTAADAAAAAAEASPDALSPHAFALAAALEVGRRRHRARARPQLSSSVPLHSARTRLAASAALSLLYCMTSPLIGYWCCEALHLQVTGGARTLLKMMKTGVDNLSMLLQASFRETVTWRSIRRW